jgi:hypothetical protein
MRSLAIFAALLTVSVPWAAGQRSTSGHAGAARAVSPRGNSVNSGGALGRQSGRISRGRRASPNSSFLFPFLGDSFTLDDLYATGYPVASEPPAFLLQAGRAMGGAMDYPGQPGGGFGIGNGYASSLSQSGASQPLMIELQNGRYVRIGGTATDGEALPSSVGSNVASNVVSKVRSSGIRSARAAASSDGATTIAPANAMHDLPPAVLVFRDGHREEVRDYTIADGVLYARGDYYMDGYWNKKIALSTLDLSQTLDANNSRSVKFVLPASANEVITRP